MTLLFDLARVAAGTNVVLLLVLSSVWGRNYLQLRSKHALGLLLFEGHESPTRATFAGAAITVCGVVLITVG